MSVLKVFQIDSVTLYAVEHPRIVAAMMEFGYVWEDVPDSAAKTEIVVVTSPDVV